MSERAGPQQRMAREMLAFAEQLAAGARTLAGLPRHPPAGATEHNVVHTLDGARLLHFAPGEDGDASLPPLLVVYALVNRHYMLDLEPERSFVRGLLAAGREVYLVDWGYPSADDRELGLDDYVSRYLHGFVETACERHGADAVDLLGVCQGGTLSLCYTAMVPQRVRRLALMVTPVDFEAEGFLLARWLRHVDVDRLVDTLGNVPGSMLNQAFLALKPLSLSGVKALDLIALLDRPDELASFARMEQWLQDSPDQAGRAFREFANGFVRDNALVAGNATIGGSRVDLAQVQQPVLNVYATRDHIVPPESSRRLRGLLSHSRYREHAFEGGHIGIFASRRGSAQIPGVVCDWYARPA